MTKQDVMGVIIDLTSLKEMTDREEALKIINELIEYFKKEFDKLEAGEV